MMITGDQRETADAIASDLGLRLGGDTLTGAELDTMSNDELYRRVSQIAVYARATAEHKFRIVQAWQAQGAVVAMPSGSPSGRSDRYSSMRFRRCFVNDSLSVLTIIPSRAGIEQVAWRPFIPSIWLRHNRQDP